jgi:hypothetical protein
MPAAGTRTAAASGRGAAHDGPKVARLLCRAGNSLSLKRLEFVQRPRQPPGDHQMDDHPQIIVHSDGDAFADPPELAYHLPLNIADRRLRKRPTLP